MRITLRDVRLAFAQGIFEATVAPGATDAKYNCAFIFGRDHEATKAVSEAVAQVAEAKWGAKAAAILKELHAKDRLPIHDGDSKPDAAGYPGNYYLNAGNKMRPLVVDRDPQHILTVADGKPYSGCYVNGIVEIWAQDNQFGKRVNASLAGVQFVRDGERLAGGSVATTNDFEKIDTGAEDADEGSADFLFK